MQNGWIFKGRRGGSPFYVCLEDEDAGGIRAGLNVGRGGHVYSGSCPNDSCNDYTFELRKQCTRNKSGRTIKRHLRQNELDGMREASRSAKAKRDIKMRQHLMERSYARGTWYGFDRARWRGLWRVQIQEYLVSAVQNIQVLLRYGSYLKTSPSVVMERIKGVTPGVIRSFLDLKELVKLKIGRRVLFGFTSPRLSFIETQTARYFRIGLFGNSP